MTLRGVVAGVFFLAVLNGNAGANDDKDCASDKVRAVECDAERIERMAGAVALVTEAGFVRRSGGNVLLDLLPAEPCKFQSRSHCSDFLDVDRRHVWTAAHCLANGAVRPPTSCAATVASNSADSPNNPLPIDGERSENDYLCISTDTLSGSSGGPVLAALPDGEVAVIGVVSRAYRVELAAECESTSEDSDRLNLASRIFSLPR